MKSVRELLDTEPYRFDFFQAVRVLEKIHRDKLPVGLTHSPEDEIVRFRAHQSLTFPPSAIFELLKPDFDRPYQLMTVSFMGLTGPSGALPTHYTQMMMDLGRDVRGPERRALRDWFDLFNHRFISLFYRAWEKYRFPIAYERGEPDPREPDSFTRSVLSLIGLGTHGLRNRLQVHTIRQELTDWEPKRVPLAKIDDLALFYFSGILSQRPRNAVNLRILIAEYFDMPVEVNQFRGQWLPIEPPHQTCLGSHGMLGLNTVAGDRVWDVQSRFRLRVGPLNYERFEECLPDRSPITERKTFFMIVQLARKYVGPELDFDVQLVLEAASVPEVQLTEGSGLGPRLGWNTWLISDTALEDVDDAVFDGELVTAV
ncbi:MAG: type VI secretion system baseplate subunit TssG [Planctomycetes bacterium]|nr:type VI secretion system baseplate subunit TssG [Planctomycetota bacterium]